MVSQTLKHAVSFVEKYSWAFLLLARATLVPAPAAAETESWRILNISRDADGQNAFTAGSLTGQTRVLVAWRSDCGPCLVELKNIALFEQAAKERGMELITLALDPADVALPKLASLKVTPRHVWYALDPDNDVLRGLAGQVPRIPVTIAINPQGELCGRRFGFLGTDILTEWAARCAR